VDLRDRAVDQDVFEVRRVGQASETPGAQRWIFDETRMRPGDVVLERAEGKVSDAIALFSRGE
jgi:hypothetical protein